jgi:hypothetical protein
MLPPGFRRFHTSPRYHSHAFCRSVSLHKHADVLAKQFVALDGVAVAAFGLGFIGETTQRFDLALTSDDDRLCQSNRDLILKQLALRDDLGHTLFNGGRVLLAARVGRIFESGLLKGDTNWLPSREQLLAVTPLLASALLRSVPGSFSQGPVWIPARSARLHDLGTSLDEGRRGRPPLPANSPVADYLNRERLGALGNIGGRKRASARTFRMRHALSVEKRCGHRGLYGEIDILWNVASRGCNL